MADREKTNLALELAHVLFMDIVGYSKLLIDEQREAAHELNNLVLKTDAAREAEAAGTLIRLPTGDGMALVFTSSMEAPVKCALQISQALRARPSLPLRMGIHSGSVQHVTDVNGRENVAGSGINIAQRVMDCGDAGHILVSKRVADDLAGSRRWAPYLHDLGECEVKHGLIVSLVNLYADVVGNPVPPARLSAGRSAGGTRVPGGGKGAVSRWLMLAGALFVGASVFAVRPWTGNGRKAVPAAVAPGWHPALPAAAPVAAAVPADLAAREKSIAVLPFENLSDDKQDGYFSDGVQDEILTDLAKVADLKVIARSSVMQYRSDIPRDPRLIATQLVVSNLLEGSVQRSAGKVRVHVQLIDARSATQVWAEKYDRDYSDVFAIQSDIAQAITDQLKARLSSREMAAIQERPTADLAAYDLYLRAKELVELTGFNVLEQGLPPAIRLLNEAVQRDPGFLLAYCLLARAHSDLWWVNIDHTPQRLVLEQDALDHAVRLAPDSGEVHLARAVHLYRALRDYDGAMRELDRARLTRPNNADIYLFRGGIARRQGRWEESVRDFEKAMSLNPRGINLIEQQWLNFQFMHRYADEVGLLDNLLLLVPHDPDVWRAGPGSV